MALRVAHHRFGVGGFRGLPAADAFIAQYERIETPDSLAEYTMDHTSLLYLMDENWQLKTFFAEADADPDYISNCLQQHIG